MKSRTLFLPALPDHKISFNPDPSFPSLEQMIASARDNPGLERADSPRRAPAQGGRAPAPERSESAGKPAPADTVT